MFNTVLFNEAVAEGWGSSITPELIAYCKKAGGTPSQFRCTNTDTCDDYLTKKNSARPSKCGQAVTAGCDCGTSKCLKNDKCIPNPKRAFFDLR